MAADKPNIILITTDQQRFGTFAAWAPSFLRTPHQNYLAREGVTFARAYAEGPLCVPARASIMTGQSPFRHGLIGNGITSRHFGSENTLPSCLAAAGYQTIAIGKMHFGPQRVRHGFQEMLIPDDYYRHMARSGSPLQPMRHGLGQNEFTPAMATVPEALTLTSWIAERAVDFIEHRRDPTQPFFLWVSFSKPHPPLDPPEPYYSMYRPEDIPPPVVGAWRDDQERCPTVFAYNQWRSGADVMSESIWREARAAYYGLITQVDYAMGRVFAALSDQGLLDDALILYTSDHGEFLGDQRASQKGFFHEPSARVPFILRLPKSWEDRHGDEVVTVPVTHADILPTLVSVAGAPPPDIDGLDLISLLRGELVLEHRFIFAVSDSTFHDPDRPDFLALTDGKHKYIWYPEGSWEQLFDLETDPQELRDLAEEPDHAAVRDHLHSVLRREMERVAPRYLVDGQILALPARDRSRSEARSRGNPGFHGESYPIDTRH